MHLESLEIINGRLHVSLPVLNTPTETIGVLNCGPEDDI
jgi:hypothetical protein